MTPAKAATLSGLLAILLWSSLALLTTATDGLPPFQVLALGFGFAAVFGFVRTALRGDAGWKELRQPASALALTTTALFGYHALYFIALKRAPAVEANLLNYLWPLLIVLFAGFLPGVRVHRGQWVGTLLGLAAAVILVTHGTGIEVKREYMAGYLAALCAAVILVTHGTGIEIKREYMAGYLAALCAAVIWAAYSVLNRRHATVPSAAITVACALVAILGASTHLAFEQSVMPSAMQWTVLILMGLGPVGAAFLLWDHGTKHGDIALLGSLSYLAPLLSTLLLVAAGRAEPHASQAVAIGLLLLGAWLSVRTPKTAG